MVVRGGAGAGAGAGEAAAPGAAGRTPSLSLPKARLLLPPTPCPRLSSLSLPPPGHPSWRWWRWWSGGGEERGCYRGQEQHGAGQAVASQVAELGPALASLDLRLDHRLHHHAAQAAAQAHAHLLDLKSSSPPPRCARVWEGVG
eukprot:1754229-Rhodomonas_salina.1